MKLLPLLLLSVLLCQDAAADDALSDEHRALLKIDQHLADLSKRPPPTGVGGGV